MLVGQPDRRVGRRSFLRTAGLLAAAGVTGVGPLTSGNRVDERVLNIYNWSDYIDERTIPLYQAQSNLRINYDVFSSNEDLLAKMRAGPTTYDIIVPTNNFIPTYLTLDLIEPLRQDLMPNLANIDREFVDTDYDPGNRYTIPYQWARPGSASTASGPATRSTPGGRCSSRRRIWAGTSPCCAR
jgi:spermidine/putrescine-binding protein